MNSTKATNIRWRVLFITLVIGYIAYVYRGNLSVIGKFLMDDTGITQTELGWLLSSFLWGYTLFQFPGGLLSEKIGPKNIFLLTTLGCTLITVITGLIVIGGFSLALMIPLLFICRFLLGVFQGPLFPAMAGGVIARWFPSGSRRKASEGSKCTLSSPRMSKMSARRRQGRNNQTREARREPTGAPGGPTGAPQVLAKSRPESPRRAPGGPKRRQKRLRRPPEGPQEPPKVAQKGL